MALIVDGEVVDEHDKTFFRRAQTQFVRSRTVVSNGVSLGSAIAVTISWSVHHSILWAIFHGFLSWFYVLFYAITR